MLLFLPGQPSLHSNKHQAQRHFVSQTVADISRGNVATSWRCGWDF